MGKSSSKNNNNNQASNSNKGKEMSNDNVVETTCTQTNNPETKETGIKENTQSETTLNSDSAVKIAGKVESKNEAVDMDVNDYKDVKALEAKLETINKEIKELGKKDFSSFKKFKNTVSPTERTDQVYSGMSKILISAASMALAVNSAQKLEALTPGVSFEIQDIAKNGAPTTSKVMTVPGYTGPRDLKYTGKVLGHSVVLGAGTACAIFSGASGVSDLVDACEKRSPAEKIHYMIQRDYLYLQDRYEKTKEEALKNKMDEMKKRYPGILASSKRHIKELCKALMEKRKLEKELIAAREEESKSKAAS